MTSSRQLSLQKESKRGHEQRTQAVEGARTMTFGPQRRESWRCAEGRDSLGVAVRVWPWSSSGLVIPCATSGI